LLDIVALFAIFRSTFLFFLLFLAWCAWCVRRCCSLFDALNATTPFACSSTSLLCCSLFLTRCCYSCSSCFRLVFPHLVFCKCGRNCPNSSFEARPRKWDLFVQSLFIDDFFYHPCCFWKFLDENVFFCCARIVWTLYI
jgi:hypothetical protein